MTRVKICGISTIAQALAISASGADYLGLVFAASRRQVTPDKAREIYESLQDSKSRPKIIGIFVNVSSNEINRIAEYCRLDGVQLSGDEPWEYCREIELPIIKALHISSRSTSRDLIEEIEKGYQLISRDRLICLLDTGIQGAYGGTGQTFNWKLAREVASRFPIMVAGGLTPHNVNRLISEVKPWGVDVSSGVETDGKKDIAKIQKFVNEARRDLRFKI